MRKPKLRVINRKKPITQVLANHIFFYPTPGNFNYAYSFGSLVGLFFATQILTGIFLGMHYISELDKAFESVLHIMNDVPFGYIIRFLHANGASVIFTYLYFHIARGLYFRSYTGARRWLWWSGVIIFLLMMATAFIGYVLPWGQMSFWGATVITSLVTAVPFVGDSVANWIWGGYSVSAPTLTRFYSIHYLLPFIIMGLILVHLILLHTATSSNPNQTSDPDRFPFHPYFTNKDIFALTFALLWFILIIFFFPNVLGHPDNYITANPVVTPAHIVPEWYFTPFYAILRGIPDKLGGVIAMLSSILIWVLLPFYKAVDMGTNGPRSRLHHLFFWVFCFVFFMLLVLGGAPATQPYVAASQLFSIVYFAYFLVVLAILPYIETYLLKYFNFRTFKPKRRKTKRSTTYKERYTRLIQEIDKELHVYKQYGLHKGIHK
jgi:quinol-cytochrome oxidoreductase complex cytochrome b subunit